MRGHSGPPRNHTPGFMPSKSQAKPIKTIDNLHELRDILEKTTKLLGTCSAGLRPQLESRRAECQARIDHLSGMKNVQTNLENVHLDPSFAALRDAEMIDAPTASGASSSTVATKLRILSSPVSKREQTHKSTLHSTALIDHREAMRLQQVEAEKQIARREAAEASRLKKEQRLAEVIQHYPELSYDEKNSRILAFLTARPTDSDEEYDDDDEDMDDEEMQTLLNAEYEDGIKGQDIVDPDDIADIIQVDHDRAMLDDQP